MFWMAAHDETPLCEKCGAEVSGAPNAGVFGLRPSRMVYERLIERSKKPSPWCVCNVCVLVSSYLCLSFVTFLSLSFISLSTINSSKDPCPFMNTPSALFNITKAADWCNDRYGDRWAYSEQELLSVFFLVEKETHNSRIIW